VDRFVARGTPVVLEASSEQAFARAEYIECFYAARRIRLEGAQGAWLRHRDTEMEALELDYALHSDDPQRLGSLVASGPGRIHGVTESAGNNRSFEARWTDSLQLRPRDGQHVLSLFGQAGVTFNGVGGFSADEIHLFLMEDATESSPGSTEQASSKRKVKLQPERLVAQGHVRVDSPWLKSNEPRDELKVWFVPEGGVTTDQSPLPEPETPTATALPPSVAGIEKPSGPPLEFQGEVIEARVLAGPETMRLDDVTVAGRIRITQPATQPGGQPLQITGDLLRISGIADRQVQVQVHGKPAEAGAEGLVLRGARIIVDQASNMMTIPGAGEMLTPHTAGQTVDAPPMAIAWSDSVEFDGSTAVFHGQIIARGQRMLEHNQVAHFTIRGRDMRA
jgi:hypothetical protein